MNKINTKVEVRFNLASADWIPEDIRQKLLKVVSIGSINLTYSIFCTLLDL